MAKWWRQLAAVMTSRYDKMYTMISVVVRDDGYLAVEQVGCDCVWDEAKAYIEMAKDYKLQNATLHMVDQEKVVAFLSKIARKNNGKLGCEYQSPYILERIQRVH